MPKKTINIIVIALGFLLFYFALSPLPVKVRIIFLTFFAFIALLNIEWFPYEKFDRMFDRMLGMAKKAPRNFCKRIHSLANTDIRSVNIVFDKGAAMQLLKPPVIETLKKCFAEAEITGPDIEAEQLKIKINTAEKTFSYEGFVPDSSRCDVILKIPECSDYGEIRLPGLKRWLDENVLSKEK